jgi:CubicO group peptidase (beta-lactamase class C family)
MILSRLLYWLLGGLWLLVGATSVLVAQNSYKARQIQEVMQTLYANNQFNGTVLVAQEGQVIYKGAFGWANYESQDTLRTNTSIRIASVSKQFTAMSIMILKEQGKLSYDDPITRFLPELPYDHITIRHLLLHQSGLPDYFMIHYALDAYYPGKAFINNWDVVRFLANTGRKPLFTPGTKGSYCNTGYVLLACIVERASGQTFPSFLTQYIFHPLDMRDSYVYPYQSKDTLRQVDTLLLAYDTIINRSDWQETSTVIQIKHSQRLIDRQRAIGYTLGGGGQWVRMDYLPYDGIYGEKSICTSVEDLFKWDQALYTEKLVSKATLQEAFKPSYLTERNDLYYGFGWKIESKRTHVVFHHGLYRGFRSFIQRNLQKQTTIIILTNRGLGGQMYPIYQAIEAILSDDKVTIPKPLPIERQTLDVFKRRYFIRYDTPQTSLKQ